MRGVSLKTGTHSVLFHIVRVGLGGVFVYASVDKILYPALFAEAVYNYQILPDYLVNLTALILPWLELIIGALLVIGYGLPGAILISSFLLIIFMGALTFNLARGLDVSCGCFSTAGEGGTGSDWYLLRDLLFLVMAGFLFFQAFFRESNSSQKGTNHSLS